MATKSNSKNNVPTSQKAFKVGYTENQIASRAVDTNRTWWSVRCFNESAHKNGDTHPSAWYCAETGYYGCAVCDLKGYANDRNRPDWNKHQVRTYSNGVNVNREIQPSGKKKIWQLNTKTRELPKPYGHETIHTNTRRIYVVEGEKCADAVQPHLNPNSEAVITSIQGSQSPRKTDWAPVFAAIKNGAEVVFLPDRDAPGEKYIQSVAEILNLDKRNVIRLGGDREDGYDIANWLEEGNSWDDLPDVVSEQVTPTTNQDRRHAVHREIVRSSAYDREVGHLSVEERIRENREKIAENPNWLVHGFVCSGHTTLIYGNSSAGKSTLVRYLVSHIVQHTDPFNANDTLMDLKEQPGRVLWWMGEEHVPTTRKAFESANIDWDRIDILDRTHKWWPNVDQHELSGGDVVPVSISPYTDMLITIDQAKRDGDPYQAIVIDTIPQLLGDTNKSDVFEQRWEQLIVPLERRGLAVIAIAHPRKDNPVSAPLEASLKGTERLFSLPRLVAFARSAKTSDLLRQSNIQEAGAIAPRNPIRDRFNQTGDSPPPPEDRGLIGVIVPLKNSYLEPEQLKAWQYSIIDHDGVGIAQFSREPWNASDISTEQLDGRSFGATIADTYQLKRREKQTAREKQAHEANLDREAEQKTLKNLFRQVAKDHPDGIDRSELREIVEQDGYTWRSGQVDRVRIEVFRYDVKTKNYISKQK